MIRTLVPSDTDAFLRLRRAALESEPLAFSSSPGDDHAGSPEAVAGYMAQPNCALFGAFDPELVGVAGIAQETGAKSRHKVRIGGVYVTPSRRGQGLGRGLMLAAIDFGPSLDGISQAQLSVAEPARAARALYERLGFVTWGIEPGALRVGNTSVAEHHMVLTLDHRVG